VREAKDPAFIEGRQGEILVGGKGVGVFGEIHPRVLENFGIPNPVVAFEIELDSIFNCGDLL
jgi:phenylalanyl-tRNA synthetase beta chain